MKTYEINMEIAGPFAMWARPDTGSAPTSYPVPTWSAAKGIFESIAFLRDGSAWINPTRVEVCKRKDNSEESITFQKYTNNYRGCMQDEKEGAFQFSCLILVNVCYRLYARIEQDNEARLNYKYKGTNPCHYLHHLFNRRLKQGRCHKTPCLGWNEFTASYWGTFRQEIEVDTNCNRELVSVLKQVFNEKITLKGESVLYKTSYQRDDQARIKEGIFKYVE